MRLLVSVTDAEEARVAVEAGVDIVDVKNPAEGSLGAPRPGVIETSPRGRAAGAPGERRHRRPAQPARHRRARRAGRRPLRRGVREGGVVGDVLHG